MPSGSLAADWPSAAPEALGFDADLAEKLDAGFRSGLLNGLHSVLIARKGQVVLERYYKGRDESWGAPLGVVEFSPEKRHDLRSVTKSIVGLLYGIALDRGLVPPPDASLLPLFPEYADLAADPRRAKLTVGQALSMTLGLAWDEMRPYSDPANSEIAMENAPDRYRFILEQPSDAEPGARWTYSGGAVALVGAIIARGTGQSLPDFLKTALLAPLGIDTFEWAAGRDGVPSAASGLRLRPRDLLRIGQMVLNKGAWGDRQIVPRAWLAATATPETKTNEEGFEYSRLWWMGRIPLPALPGAPHRWLGGLGNGGQRLLLLPDAELAVVIHCGNYNAPDQWVTPLRVWREIILANLRQV